LRSGVCGKETIDYGRGYRRWIVSKHIEANVYLKASNTFGLAAVAETLIRIHDDADIERVLARHNHARDSTPEPATGNSTPKGRCRRTFFQGFWTWAGRRLMKSKKWNTIFFSNHP
jgi:hypothetical protein